MSKVSVYVENVFAALPATEQARQLKAEITANLEEQYQAALAAGAGEDEALGRAVSQFGSVDELREMLEADLAADQPEQAAGAPDAQQKEFAMRWVGEYMCFKKKFAKMIALGVALCTAALGLAGVLDAFSTLEWAVPIAFFGLGGIGAAVLVYYGIQHASYAKMLGMFGLDENGNVTKAPPVPTEKQRADAALADRICGLLMSVAALAFFVLGFVLRKWAICWVAFPIGGILCSIVKNAMGVPDED